MYSVYRWLVALTVVCACAAAGASTPPLRVCADANNLPFSNTRAQGFENVLGRMIARDLHRDIQFVWLPRKEHAAERLLETCDLVTGMAGASEHMTATIPYYRSTYVFVSRQDRHLALAGLTDPRLAHYRIGAQVIGDGGIVPPARELSERGLLRNLVGYVVQPLDANPEAKIITAVAQGDVDLAVAWGPAAGYFAEQSKVALNLTPLCPPRGSSTPMAFDISMGVRRGDDRLLAQVNHIIARRRGAIRVLLRSYNVPVLRAGEPAGCN